MASRKYAYQVKATRVGKRIDRYLLNNHFAMANFWSKCVEPSAWYEAEKESCVAVFLDTKLQLISWHLISLGSIKATIVEPREVFRLAIIEGATAIAMFHNHPSGNCEPSNLDCELTRTLLDSGCILGIRLLDHLVIGDDEFYSFAAANFPHSSAQKDLNIESSIHKRPLINNI